MMNDMTMRNLEYSSIKAMLLECTVSAAGRALAEKLEPSADRARVRSMLTETDEAVRLLRTGASVPLSSAEGVESLLALIGKSAVYSAADLSQLAGWLSAVGQMRKYMAAKRMTAPTIGAYAETLNDCAALRSELERCIRYGQLTDHASPELAKIRRHAAGAEEAVRKRLEQSLGKYKAYLQDQLASKRNGHYVIPVRKEHRKHVTGTVWDQSASGQTLFIEPADIAGLTAEWEMWKAEEAREEQAILAALSELVDAHEAELRLNVEAMASFDFIFARGKLALRYDGRNVEVVDEPAVRLFEARHPLLGSEAVPLTVEIGGHTRQLMITGPNTGGKTVALKTIGLLALMVQSGLLVPAAEGTAFGIFRFVMADVGDGQSLSQSLSTFSAHLAAVREMLRHADGHSLVLLDELAAGTDPGEGIALAIAVLEELLVRQTLVVATTHFNEIKTFAAQTEGCRNARMMFDPETLAPTYRLVPGEAGDSYAFAIARKHGIPELIIRRAEERLRSRRTAASERGPREAKSGGSDAADAAGGEQSAEEERLAPCRSNWRPPGKAGSKRETARRAQAGDEAAADGGGQMLRRGDCVWIYPLSRTGIVYMPMNERGDVIVQVEKRKLTFNRKRLALRIPREELYPGDDYDLDIVFESVENRKKRKIMSRKYTKDTVIVTPPEEQFD